MDDDSVTSDTPVPTPDESIADDFNADGPGAEDDHDITSELVDKLSAVIDKENGLAIFACGGTAPIVNPGLVDTQPPNDDETPPVVSRSPPVTLRWDAADGKTPCEDTKLTFPLDDTTRNNLENLLKAAAPATFGRGGQDIYDETYRKALKLDPTAFSSTFNPYELGIVDIIAQVLLPSATDSRTCRAVHAELYKLNVSRINARRIVRSLSLSFSYCPPGLLRPIGQVQASRGYSSVPISVRLLGRLSPRRARGWRAPSPSQWERDDLRLGHG